MSEAPSLYLFDDEVADGWIPFALTRPVCELRFGALSLRERWERLIGYRARGMLSRGWLSDFREAGAPDVTSLERISDGEDRYFFSSRAAADWKVDLEPPDRPTLFLIGAEPVGCFLPAGTPAPAAAWFRGPGRDAAVTGSTTFGDANHRTLPGRVLAAAHDLVRHGTDRIAPDVVHCAPAAARTEPADLPDGVHHRGGHGLFLEPGVRIEPGVLIDTSGGPVWLERNVEVRHGCRLEGPIAVGPDSRLLGGPMEGLSAGPVSYLRGELEATTVLGYANKAHAGFIGHAYLGRWVNLGAGTTNSDLKNNYGPVRLGSPAGTVETGMQKMGCLLGDHVKTAIGTLLGTGTVVGAGANLFGGSVPRWVPPFSWGVEPGGPRYRREGFVTTARRVMERRDVPTDARTGAWLEAIWERAAEPEAG